MREINCRSRREVGAGHWEGEVCAARRSHRAFTASAKIEQAQAAMPATEIDIEPLLACMFTVASHCRKLSSGTQLA